MARTFLAIGFGVILGVVGVSLVGRGEQGQRKVTTLSERNINEKIDGKEARVSMVELTYDPGESGRPHRHAGPVFGYVLEGEYELGLGDEPVKVLKTGETFYETTGILHRVSRNPGKTRTRVLAVLLQPRDAKSTTTPVPAAKRE